VKISNKKFSFFSSRNQYFPHIPYVASKKRVWNFGISQDIIFSYKKKYKRHFENIRHLEKKSLAIFLVYLES
jgi:hypothetical protein